LLWNWLQDNIKGSELQVISAEENGTHGMHSANPEKFNKLVIDFLLSYLF
jgi:pimeloyl-ACP methyl ester carboxylesterase